jgi:hypothetical protein
VQTKIPTNKLAFPKGIGDIPNNDYDDDTFKKLSNLLKNNENSLLNIK